jgi:hypothetical protein
VKHGSGVAADAVAVGDVQRRFGETGHRTLGDRAMRDAYGAGNVLPLVGIAAAAVDDNQFLTFFECRLQISRVDLIGKFSWLKSNCVRSSWVISLPFEAESSSPMNRSAMA